MQTSEVREVALKTSWNDNIVLLLLCILSIGLTIGAYKVIGGRVSRPSDEGGHQKLLSRFREQEALIREQQRQIEALRKEVGERHANGIGAGGVSKGVPSPHTYHGESFVPPAQQRTKADGSIRYRGGGGDSSPPEIGQPGESKVDGRAIPPAASGVPKKNSAEVGGQSEHVVKKGETFYSISQQYGISVEDLKMMNGKKDNGITEGERLIVAPFRKEPSTSGQLRQQGSKSDGKTVDAPHGLGHVGGMRI